MVSAPTQRQGQVLNFIQQHHARTGLIPSVREIQQAFGFSSTNAIDSHLRALERKKLISRSRKGKARSITIHWGAYQTKDEPDLKVGEPHTEQLSFSSVTDARARNWAETPNSFEAIRLDERSSIIPGDALTVMALMDPESLDAIVTDPPYGLIEFEPANHEKLRRGRGGVWRIPPKLNGVERSPLPRFTVLTDSDRQRLLDFTASFGRLALRLLKPGGHLILASNPLLSTSVFGALISAGFEKRGEIVRLVTTLRGGDRPKGAEAEFSEVSVMPRSCWEPWGLFRKPLAAATVAENLRKFGTGGFRRPSSEEPFKDLIFCPPARGRERELAGHPSLKPQRLMRYLVRAALPLARGVVMDPFAGSGSTLAAASAVGYRSIGIERDPEYISQICKGFVGLKNIEVPAD